ncbi:MAG: FAD-dependent thymidylate synthase [Andreesenia angusta]|nr:FAD-dependent thymidylate synthase [Andreesenia angusta]
MKVSLLAYTPNAEDIVSSAAKLCYSQSGVEEIIEKQSEEDRDRFLNMLMDIGHESPIEHISFTFAVEGVSRALTHQLVRHRLASYSQQSQRYVKLEQFEYIVPPSIEKDEDAREIYIKTMEEIQERYNQIADILTDKHYKEFIEHGIDEKKAMNMASKKAIEDARYIFPNACETKIVITMNARSLKNFFEHRCCERAQWEIRRLATEMLKIVKEIAPTIFKSSGPLCISGPCPEGKMTCGKIKEIREKFDKI